MIDKRGTDDVFCNNLKICEAGCKMLAIFLFLSHENLKRGNFLQKNSEQRWSRRP